MNRFCKKHVAFEIGMKIACCACESFYTCVSLNKCKMGTRHFLTEMSHECSLYINTHAYLSI
jgi:hypothetical protein